MGKRRNFSVEFKINAIDKWRLFDRNYKKTASYFEIDRKTLRSWVKVENELRSQTGNKRTQKRLKFKHHKVKI